MTFFLASVLSMSSFQQLRGLDTAVRDLNKSRTRRKGRVSKEPRQIIISNKTTGTVADSIYRLHILGHNILGHLLVVSHSFIHSLVHPPMHSFIQSFNSYLGVKQNSGCHGHSNKCTKFIALMKLTF